MAGGNTTRRWREQNHSNSWGSSGCLGPCGFQSQESCRRWAGATYLKSRFLLLHPLHQGPCWQCIQEGAQPNQRCGFLCILEYKVVISRTQKEYLKKEKETWSEIVISTLRKGALSWGSFHSVIAFVLIIYYYNENVIKNEQNNMINPWPRINWDSFRRETQFQSETRRNAKK